MARALISNTYQDCLKDTSRFRAQKKKAQAWGWQYQNNFLKHKKEIFGLKVKLVKDLFSILSCRLNKSILLNGIPHFFNQGIMSRKISCSSQHFHVSCYYTSLIANLG